MDGLEGIFIAPRERDIVSNLMPSSRINQVGVSECVALDELCRVAHGCSSG